MTDAVAVAAQAGGTLPAVSSHGSSTAQLDPAETQRFAELMRNQAGAAGHAPGALNDSMMSRVNQLGGNVKSFEDIRRSMFEAWDPRDPMKTMFMMTDASMQAHTMFAKLHVSTGLASAATSLFGTLLKNQQ